MMLPNAFERSAISFTKSEVTRAVIERYPDLANQPAVDGVLEGLSRFSSQLGIRQDRLDEMSASDLPEVVGAIVENLCTCGHAAPEAVSARAEAIRAGLQARAAVLGQGQNRLADFIKGRYETTVAALYTELITFLLINVVAFAGVLGATCVPRERRHAVFVPAMLMVASTIASSIIYVFGTNWFYTILFNDFLGVWYALWIGFIFAFLADIVMNRARVTLRILSNLPQGLTVPGC